jgi:hypothetical protein
MEEGPEDWIKAGLEGTYWLHYFGRHQHAYKYVDLPEDNLYRIETIDTWNMTIKRMEGTFSGRTKIELPGKPYTAFRIAIL